MAEKPNELASTECFEFEALRKAERYRAALVQEFEPFLEGDVLEVGAGIGQLTGALATASRVRRVVAVEPEARFCEMFKRLHPGRELIQGTLDALPAGSAWDTLVSVNVLEHIREDEPELKRWHDTLARQRGHLCLFVPARQEIYAPLDRDFGHYRRYAKSELRRKLEAAGFAIVRLSYFNLIGYFAWWVSFCLLKKRHFEPQAVVLFDRVVFPVMHLLESRLVRPPIGQSLLAIAQARPLADRSLSS